MAWELLLNSDIGRASLAVIVVTIVIAVGYARFFSKKMAEQPSEQ